MKLTDKQEQALKIAVERYRQGERFTVISGYAGSGKSTVIRFIIQALGVDPEKDVAYAAFTGKAAKVLSQKGCPNSITAHKLLYKARPMPDGNYMFERKLDLGFKVVVIDEVSMLPKPMWDLLVAHKVYILACGDPGQLPPINPDDDNHVLDKPHIFLDEIMRQAQESEIIRLSMHIREGKPLSTFACDNKQVMILGEHDVNAGLYEWADQILCATNRKRHEINQIVRKLRGFGTEPQTGDKIISLKNHWSDMSSLQHNPLTNGTIGVLRDYSKMSLDVPRYIHPSGQVPILIANIDVEEKDYFPSMILDYTALATGEKLLSPKQEYNMNKNKSTPNAPYEFVYAYGITTHKAQGSEWDKVLVFEERFPFDREEHARWLYTAATRASEKLVLVR